MIESRWTKIPSCRSRNSYWNDQLAAARSGLSIDGTALSQVSLASKCK